MGKSGQAHGVRSILDARGRTRAGAPTLTDNRTQAHGVRLKRAKKLREEIPVGAVGAQALVT
jgi:hypothetical protein